MQMITAEPDQIIMNKKCSKCHSLERVYLMYKNDRERQKTVNRMAEFDYPDVTDSDTQRIVSYLIRQQRRRDGTDRLKTGKNLVSRKCGICHGRAG